MSLSYTLFHNYGLTERQAERLQKWLKIILWLIFGFSLGLATADFISPTFNRVSINLFIIVTTIFMLSLLHFNLWRITSWLLCFMWAGVVAYSILFSYRGINLGMTIGLMGLTPLAIVFLGNRIGLAFLGGTQLFVLSLFMGQESQIVTLNIPLSLAELVITMGGISILAGLQFNTHRDFIKDEWEQAKSYKKLEDEINLQTNELLDINSNLMQEMLIREEIEIELLVQRQRYQTLFVDAPQPILVIDLQSNIVLQANRRATEILQTEMFKLLNFDHFCLYPEYQPNGEHSKTRVQEMIAQLKRDRAVISTMWYVEDSSGQLIPCELHLRYLAVQKEEIIILHIIDLRARHQLEQQLQQKQTLETLGELSGGVVHDLNNLLTVIVGYTELMLRKTKEEDSQYSMLEQMREAGQQATSMTQQVLQYTQKAQKIEESYIDLDVLTRRSIALLRFSFPANITIEYHCHTKTNWLWGQEVKLQQLIMNLIINARQAIEANSTDNKNGTIQVRLNEQILTPHTPTPLDILTGHPLPPTTYTVLEISDTGQGMDKQTQRSIFNAFFTTKSTGSGLGLATVKSIVQAYHGGISLQSELGKGTSFTIWLPMAENERPLKQLSKG